MTKKQPNDPPEGGRPPAPPPPPPPPPAPRIAAELEAAYKMAERLRAAQPSAPFCSRFTMARLYSTGNFEHIRYEVTVDIPFAVRASDVIRDVDEALSDMNPKRPQGEYAVMQAKEIVAELSKEPPDEDILAESPDEAAVRERRLERARSVIRQDEEWQQRRAAALARLDALGGSVRRGGGLRDDYDQDPEEA